jgi:hypothetical protein
VVSNGLALFLPRRKGRPYLGSNRFFQSYNNVRALSIEEAIMLCLSIG